jgi:hypothetical protein
MENHRSRVSRYGKDIRQASNSSNVLGFRLHTGGLGVGSCPAGIDCGLGGDLRWIWGYHWQIRSACGKGKTSQTGCGTMMVVTLSVQSSSGRKQNHVPPESNVNQHKGLRLLETITYNLKDIHGRFLICYFLAPVKTRLTLTDFLLHQVRLEVKGLSQYSNWRIHRVTTDYILSICGGVRSPEFRSSE